VFSACYIGKISRFARNDMLLRLFTRPSRFGTAQVQSSKFTPARPDCIGTGGVQWLFAEPLSVKCGLFMSRLRCLGIDNGLNLQLEPLNCEPLAQT